MSPVWAGDLHAHALDEVDHEILLEFHNAQDAEKLEECFCVAGNVGLI
jgi:hypothetical protein